MKLNKYIKAAAALLVAATALAGCKFDGTTASFKDENKNSYKATWDEVNESGSIVDVGLDSAIAKTDEVATIVIVTRGELDENSITAAFDVYPLTKNETAGYAPVRGAALAKSLKTVDVEHFTGGAGFGTGSWYDRPQYGWDPSDPNQDDPGASGVITTIKFDVDTSSVTTDYVAFVADATKLKEKTGNLVLNGNENEKCGEESDSLIDYFNITTKSDKTTATDSLGAFVYERFAPTFDLDIDDEEFVVEDGKQTGKIKYSVYAPAEGYSDGLGYKVIYADKDAFTAELNKMYSFRTLPVGATNWTETPLTWTEGADDHTYTAEAEVAYGTKYCIATKTNNSLEWALVKDLYGGHTPRLGYSKDRKWYDSVSTYQYIKDEPVYIVNDPDNSESVTAVAFTANYYYLNTIRTLQDGILDLVKGDGYFIVKINATYEAKDVRLSAVDGFVVTDDKFNKIKTKAPVVYSKDEKGTISVLIEYENKNLTTTDFKYWVGEGTTITGNKLHNDVQVKFGTVAIEEDDYLAGYVKIN
jgi:hypothetical protein